MARVLHGGEAESRARISAMQRASSARDVSKKVGVAEDVDYADVQKAYPNMSYEQAVNAARKVREYQKAGGYDPYYQSLIREQAQKLGVSETQLLNEAGRYTKETRAKEERRERYDTYQRKKRQAKEGSPGLAKRALSAVEAAEATEVKLGTSSPSFTEAVKKSRAKASLVRMNITDVKGTYQDIKKYQIRREKIKKTEQARAKQETELRAQGLDPQQLKDKPYYLETSTGVEYFKTKTQAESRAKRISQADVWRRQGVYMTPGERERQAAVSLGVAGFDLVGGGIVRPQKAAPLIQVGPVKKPEKIGVSVPKILRTSPYTKEGLVTIPSGVYRQGYTLGLPTKLGEKEKDMGLGVNLPSVEIPFTDVNLGGYIPLSSAPLFIGTLYQGRAKKERQYELEKKLARAEGRPVPDKPDPMFGYGSVGEAFMAPIRYGSVGVTYATFKGVDFLTEQILGRDLPENKIIRRSEKILGELGTVSREKPEKYGSFKERFDAGDFLPGIDYQPSEKGVITGMGIGLGLSAVIPAIKVSSISKPIVSSSLSAQAAGSAVLGIGGYASTQVTQPVIEKISGSRGVSILGSSVIATGIMSAPAVGKIIKTRVLPPIMKRISGRYLPTQKMPYGLKLTAAHTEPISKGKLISTFGNKKSVVAHATDAIKGIRTGKKIDILSFPEKAKGFRQRGLSLGLYESLPSFELNKPYIKNLISQVNIKSTPTLPKTTGLQKQILNIMKREGGIVKGSYVLKTFYKKSRKFQDLDFMSDKPKSAALSLVDDLNKLYKNRFSVGSLDLGDDVVYRVFDKTKKDYIVDISRTGYRHSVKASDVLNIGGYKMVSPQYALKTKLYELGVKTRKGIAVKPKVYKDIQTVLGQRVDYKRLITQRPQAYTAYFSETIPKDYSSSIKDTRFSLFGQKRNILVREAKVKYFPAKAGESLREYNIRTFAKQQTMLPGENVLGQSVERQVTSPPVMPGVSKGMRMEITKDYGFTYEVQTLPAPKWLSKIPGGTQINKWLRTEQLKTNIYGYKITPILDDAFGVGEKSTTKTLLTPKAKPTTILPTPKAKPTTVLPTPKTKPTTGVSKISSINLGDYTRSYGRIKYVTGAEIFSRSFGSGALLGSGSIGLTSSFTPQVSAPTPTPSASPVFSSRPSKAPKISYSPYITPSYSPVKSLTKSIYPSVTASPSLRVSPTVSPSISPSISPSVSPSISPSLSPSVSPSISPSVSPSISPSLSPSVSPSISPSVSPTISPYVSVAPRPFPALPKKKEKKHPGYDVYVKRKQAKKGKGNYLSRGYKKANTQTLTKPAAYNLGATYVDKYTNRSFRLKKSKKSAKAGFLERKSPMLEAKMRKKKNNPNIFVEKTAYAIDSLQEKQGIPFESIRLRREGIIPYNKKIKRGKKNAKLDNSDFSRIFNL